MPWIVVLAAAVIVGLLIWRVTSSTGRGRSQLASRAGFDLRIDDLLEELDTFDVYFSGPQQATPAALLFIPREEKTPWDLPAGHLGWRQLETATEIREVVGRLKKHDMYRQLRLRALFGPEDDNGEQSEQQPKAMLYAVATRVPRRSKTDARALTLTPIREPLGEGHRERR